MCVRSVSPSSPWFGAAGRACSHLSDSWAPPRSLQLFPFPSRQLFSARCGRNVQLYQARLKWSDDGVGNDWLSIAPAHPGAIRGLRRHRKAETQHRCLCHHSIDQHVSVVGTDLSLNTVRSRKSGHERSRLKLCSFSFRPDSKHFEDVKTASPGFAYGGLNNSLTFNLQNDASASPSSSCVHNFMTSEPAHGAGLPSHLILRCLSVCPLSLSRTL